MFEATRENTKTATKLVFITACCSEESGNAFVEVGVPHVVAVKKGQSISGEVSAAASGLSLVVCCCVFCCTIHCV